MVSILGLAGTQRPLLVSKLAAFLDTPEGDVTQLLKEGRLDAAILTTLRRRGVVVTPKVKNSVQALIRTMEPKGHAPDPQKINDTSVQTDGTATIMFTDIVGSSNIMERLGDRAGRVVLSKHDEIIRRQVAVHDGLEVKSMGDGFMLTPNPPKDTDGRREGSGRGWVRELQGRWPGVLG